MEMGSSKICWSMEPVMRCPAGSYPASQDSDYGYESSTESKRGQQKNGKKVKFTCMNRTSDEARRLLRGARRGEVLEMDEHQASMTEFVEEPEKCLRY
jgi:hypothetical protein